MEKIKCNFKLKVSTIREFNSTMVHTNKTLTDEVAIAYLKVNINRLKQFSKYPSNLDELLSGKKPQVKKVEELVESKPKKKETKKKVKKN